MSDFEWVTRRADCSAGVLFEQLKAQVQKDIETRDAICKAGGPPFNYAFRFKTENDTIIAMIEGHRLHESVTFRLNRNAIEVRGKDGNLSFTGVPTLNNEAECRLKVNGEELELWQFRKKALEDLLFVVPEDYMRSEEQRII